MPSRDPHAPSLHLYREVNKHIRAVTGSWEEGSASQYLCECGRSDCRETFELTQAQFDGLAGEAGVLLLSAEHRGSADNGAVLAEYPDFLVVRMEERAGSTG